MIVLEHLSGDNKSIELRGGSIMSVVRVDLCLNRCLALVLQHIEHKSAGCSVVLLQLDLMN